VKCPFCGHEDTQVKDSRPSEDGGSIRRRRFCPACDSRFTTFERVQLRELTVIKRNGDRRPFDRDKIARSMAVALRKRPVDGDQVERTINRLVQTLEGGGENEIACETIGNLVMDALRELDQVAYIRYASVYRDFREASDFGRFMEELRDETTELARTGSRP
jgi:transcriptional repressor NrdR